MTHTQFFHLATSVAAALVAEPVVLINSAGADDPIVAQRLFNP